MCKYGSRFGAIVLFGPFITIYGMVAILLSVVLGSGGGRISRGPQMAYVYINTRSTKRERVRKLNLRRGSKDTSEKRHGLTDG